ncbi:MAG: AraC family transcriptional activator of mtrCDE [Arenicella sp.]|jgi:AraC-like DNA-binding protein
MIALNQLLAAVRVQAKVIHNGRYCGQWAVDTSGTRKMTFHVVSQGLCYLIVQEQTFELNAGDVVFFPSDAPHRVSNSRDIELLVNQTTSIPMTDNAENSTGLVCGYIEHQHPIFEKLLKQLPSWIIIPHDQNSASSSVIRLMLTESAESGNSANLLLNRLSDCLFYLLLRDHIDTDSGVLSALAHPKIGRSLELIHQQTAEKLTLNELASQAGMSRSAFSTLFKQLLGQSPYEYLTQWRMTQAYWWLVDDGISTLEAADRCGYASESAFSKAFKRVMGHGPGEVRLK